MTYDPCKVLVVDDNQDCADSTAMLLRQYGHEAHTAYAPPEALAKARELQPHVIIMDVGLPGKNGFELAADIRTACPDCRIIALTGFTHDQVVRQSKKAGFNGHLTKPADPEVLNAAVSKECHNSASQDCPNPN